MLVFGIIAMSNVPQNGSRTPSSTGSSSWEDETIDPQGVMMSVIHSTFVTQSTRRRLHIPHHRTVHERTDDAFAKRILPNLVSVLTMDKAHDEHYNGRAASVASKIAQVIAHGKDNHNDVMRRIMFHLKDADNRQLREDIVNQIVTAENLVTMSDEQLSNPETQKRIAQKRAEMDQARDEQFLNAQEHEITTMFQCPHCNGRECYTSERASDQLKFWVSNDDAEVLITCIKCGHAFKK